MQSPSSLRIANLLIFIVTLICVRASRVEGEATNSLVSSLQSRRSVRPLHGKSLVPTITRASLRNTKVHGDKLNVNKGDVKLKENQRHRQQKEETFNETEPEEENDSRIVGGRLISCQDRYPYLTALFQFVDDSCMQTCGGVLVSTNAVVTAAHCASKVDYVNIGAYDLNSPNDSVESFYVTDKIIHPNYTSANLFSSSSSIYGTSSRSSLSSYPELYDVMVLILDGSSSHQPIHLNSNIRVPSTDQEELVVMGWGATSYGGQGVMVPREATVYAMDGEECWSSYESINSSSNSSTAYSDVTPSDSIHNRPSTTFLYSDDYVLCAYSPGHDACTYDSGGPLIVSGGNSTTDASDDLLVGIVSFGKGCAYQDYPGVYTRVSGVESWISSVIQEYS